MKGQLQHRPSGGADHRTGREGGRPPEAASDEVLSYRWEAHLEDGARRQGWLHCPDPTVEGYWLISDLAEDLANCFADPDSPTKWDDPVRRLIVEAEGEEPDSYEIRAASTLAPDPQPTPFYGEAFNLLPYVLAAVVVVFFLGFAVGYVIGGAS